MANTTSISLKNFILPLGLFKIFSPAITESPGLNTGRFCASDSNGATILPVSHLKENPQTLRLQGNNSG